MTLSQLPTEIILIIASCFCKQGDISALVRTNRQLYGTLIKFLYCFHGYYKHGVGLCFAAERNLVPQVLGLLDGMVTARDYPRASDLVKYIAEDKVPNGYQDETTLSSKEQYLCELDHPENPFTQNIYVHRLFQQGYSVLSILNIQHALILAIRGGHTQVVVTLLDFGAHVNFYYRTQFDHIAPENYTYWWYRRGADYPPLFTAVQSGNLELVSLLLQRGADADTDISGPSPLYCAVKDGRRDIIPILLQYSVGQQKTALKLAVLNEDESMVRFLLDQGLNVSKYAHTGLFAAEQKCYWGIFNLLQSRGATLDALSDTDELYWEEEDGDGFASPIPRVFHSDFDGLDEPDYDSDEDLDEDE